MIQRLSSNQSFMANETKSARETYDSLMTQNSQTAQKQNKVIANLMPIPMQGTGQKLDVMA